MRALRWAGASLLGLLAGLLGLVGAILCLTLILAPLGIPILLLARRLFKSAGALVVARGIRHPVDELSRSGRDGAETAKGKAKRLRKKGKKTGRKARRKAGKAMP